MAFRTGGVVLTLLLAACLCIFVPPLMVCATLFAAALLWVVFRYPIGALGAVLAFMPVDYMAIELGKFFGFPHMTLVSTLDKEVILLVLAFILWRRNGFKPTAPDWLLLACFTLAALRTVFSGSLVALAYDFDFLIAYAVGRVAVLTATQEVLWAKCAVWIAAILSVLGLIEVFMLGEGPRTLLYLATDAETEGGGLTYSFHATGFTGLREAATMAGPNGFGALCMIALILWWVYCRNPLPAAMIVTGLVCSLTRSAWLGAAAAIPLLAFRMDQRKRLVLYATLALALFVISIPALGLSDYLFFTKTGQDPSAEGHRAQIVDGLKYAADHPLGSGNERLSPVVFQQENNVTLFETTYPLLAAEYGIPAALCFVASLLSAIYVVWRKQPLSYAALGILVSMGLVMLVTLPLHDRRLAWAWFPIGLAVRPSLGGAIQPES